MLGSPKLEMNGGGGGGGNLKKDLLKGRGWVSQSRAIHN